jgi:hypothetical protein
MTNDFMGSVDLLLRCDPESFNLEIGVRNRLLQCPNRGFPLVCREMCKIGFSP